jgi:catechol 2,3-dioxygenase-like lactoylglutathione lyase family enzyme
MCMAFNRTKLVVADLDAAVRFYGALGFKSVRTTLSGEGAMRQEQRWLVDREDPDSVRFTLMHFPELPPPPRPAYPNEVWLVLLVADVDAAIAIVEREGGAVISAPKDEVAFSVRAAVATDHEGHILEFVGPMAER